MKKTDAILQHLAERGPATSADIAAALDEETKNVAALASYLRGKGRVETHDGGWRITKAGRTWLADIAEERSEDACRSTPAISRPLVSPTPTARISAPLRKANGHAVTAAAAPAGFKTLPPIEHGIAIPLAVRSGAYRELAQQMQPGDSVLFENDSKAANLRVALRALGHKSVQRQSKDGCRVWRVS